MVGPNCRNEFSLTQLPDGNRHGKHTTKKIQNQKTRQNNIVIHTCNPQVFFFFYNFFSLKIHYGTHGMIQAWT